ncbi:MAG: hypothetical protein JSS64_13300 [Bacteroidetes bacterium]|nr:hypothetical protein [Bacteroidota bacterium]MBS1777247.1 hypothetical protein [Bacteroidota bacterium]
MRFFIVFLLSLFVVQTASARLLKNKSLEGIYLQWGYNREWFTRSTIHFQKEGEYDFRLVNAVAHDKPDFGSIISSPLDISIPQYNYRIGFYLNPQHTHAFELSFDHAKYVVTDYQKYHIEGFIDGQYMNKDTVVDPAFLHFEHTDGANFVHFNYVGIQPLYETPKKRTILAAIVKLGAGFVIPRTDVTYKGARLNNKFHIAGYVASAELGARVYPLRNLFLEATVKGGYANYINSLASEGGKANHHFGYVECIGLIGYDIALGKHRSSK